MYIRTGVKRKLRDQHVASMDGRLADRGIALGDKTAPQRQYASPSQTIDETRIQLMHDIRMTGDQLLDEYVKPHNTTALVSTARMNTNKKQKTITLDATTGFGSHPKSFHTMAPMLQDDAARREAHVRANGNRKQPGRMRLADNRQMESVIPVKHEKRVAESTAVDHAAMRHESKKMVGLSFVIPDKQKNNNHRLAAMSKDPLLYPKPAVYATQYHLPTHLPSAPRLLNQDSLMINQKRSVQADPARTQLMQSVRSCI